jgi:hypothetical protein
VILLKHKEPVARYKREIPKIKRQDTIAPSIKYFIDASMLNSEFQKNAANT